MIQLSKVLSAIVQRALNLTFCEGLLDMVAKVYKIPDTDVTSDALNDRNTRLKRIPEREVETMSKQSTRQQSRQERRREEQRRHEEERQRAARRKRITTVGLVAVGVLVVVGLVYFVIVQRQTPTNAAYPPIDNVSCDSLEHSDFHIHAHVTIYIGGNKVPIPAQVGIAPDGSCLYWLHTHSDDGVIHIEAPKGLSITLKNFLDIWEQRFQQLGYPSQLAQSGGWQVYVNGKPFTGDFHTIPLQAHTLITLAYNSPGVQPDINYNWNGL